MTSKAAYARHAKALRQINFGAASIVSNSKWACTTFRGMGRYWCFVGEREFIEDLATCVHAARDGLMMGGHEFLGPFLTPIGDGDFRLARRTMHGLSDKFPGAFGDTYLDVLETKLFNSTGFRFPNFGNLKAMSGLAG